MIDVDVKIIILAGTVNSSSKTGKIHKKSIKTKRLTCGWENDYLNKVIEGMNVDNIIEAN